MRRILTCLPALGLLTVLLSGCAPEAVQEEADNQPEPEIDTPAVDPDPFADNRLVANEVTPEMQADMDKSVPAAGEEVVVFDTAKGEIVVMLYAKVAPKTVASFKKLVNEGFYDGTRFHRCIPGFMIQGGDIASKDLDNSGMWGRGNPGFTILDELNPIRHVRGVLSMAHSGPNTGGSQFFIMDGVADNLNYLHTAFGRILSGQDVVAAIIATGDEVGIVDPATAVVLKGAKVVAWPIE